MNRIIAQPGRYQCGEVPLFERDPVYCFNCRQRQRIERRLERATDTLTRWRIKVELRQHTKEHPCEKIVVYLPFKY